MMKILELHGRKFGFILLPKAISCNFDPDRDF